MTATEPAPQARSLAERLVAGERAALARALTVLERGGARARALLAAIAPHLGGATVVGFTGPPGAGKSTLVGAFVAQERAAGRTVGVIAVDPSSPLSGGAILGDRLRMSAHVADDGVFIRSLASRGHVGGLSPAAAAGVDAFDAAGWDVVVLETVGAGQSEVEIAEIADIRVVLNAPGLGDEVQAMKAGILEIADILVVNKADQPAADRMTRGLQAALAASVGRGETAILQTVATTGEGVEALAEEIRRRVQTLPPVRMRRLRRARRLISYAANAAVARRLATPDQYVDQLAEDLLSAEIDSEEAARRFFAALSK
ncbi:MAG: methylmalonyl Co-A mutase-associated GTPase MeaB [Pseudomonadota bacterium]